MQAQPRNLSGKPKPRQGRAPAFHEPQAMPGKEHTPRRLNRRTWECRSCLSTPTNATSNGSERAARIRETGCASLGPLEIPPSRFERADRCLPRRLNIKICGRGISLPGVRTSRRIEGSMLPPGINPYQAISSGTSCLSVSHIQRWRGLTKRACAFGAP